MKYALSLLFPVILLMTACDQTELSIYQYAAVVTPLTLNSPHQATGSVTFTHTMLVPGTKEVCDSVACGTQWANVCGYVDQCNDVTPPPVCTIVDRVRKCSQGLPQNVCNVVKQCHEQTVTKYCQTNCKTVSTTYPVQQYTYSAVTLNILGASAETSDMQLEFASRMTDVFRLAYSDPSTRPEGSSDIFNQLQANDQSVLILRSQQYQLVPGQQAFFNLPSNFQPGDPIILTVQVQINDSENPYSAVGATAELPSLQTQ